ncbi:hypothetical protein Slin15195_G117450 [Septoria linicola]|uniref:Uncharacterized protein n=1 Tax=Septoria linicola TaxID=215465 RepID=A0A9Q9EP38_9PEZI|nr:hypothetical protein Slin15195_G117450 [Septoria linicola]
MLLSVVLLASTAVALPIPLLQDFDIDNVPPQEGPPARPVKVAETLAEVAPGPSTSRKLRKKRQYDWSWYTNWYIPNNAGSREGEDPHWTSPSRNPFDICETPEGKRLGAQCSGGSIQADHTDGWYTDHTDVHFTSWTIGPPDKPGWNPFAADSNSALGANRLGGNTIGGSRTNTIPNTGTLPINNGGGVINDGGGGTNNNIVPKPKPKTGVAGLASTNCMDVLVSGTLQM